MSIKIPDQLYNVLKYVTTYVLPSVGAFYLVISSIWGLPYGEQVTGTIVAIEALIGGLIGLSSAQYKKTHTITVEDKAA